MSQSAADTCEGCFGGSLLAVMTLGVLYYILKAIFVLVFT